MSRKKPFSYKKQIIFLAVGLLAAGMVVITMCVQMLGQMTVVTHKETNRYLSEISEKTSMTINIRMEMTFQLLEALGSSYLAMPEKNRNEVMERQLKRFAQTYGMSWISIVFTDGSALCSENHSQHAKELQHTFEEVLKAQNDAIVTRIRKGSDSSYEGIVYARPLYQNDTIIGAITAWSAVETLRDVVSIDTLDGEGYSVIVDRNGDYVVASANKNANHDATNFFELIEADGTVNLDRPVQEMKMKMEQGESGSLEYSLSQGTLRILHYTPLEYDELYLLSIVPIEAAGQTMDNMVYHSILIVIIVVAMFFLLIVYTLVSSVLSQKKIKHLAFRDPVTGGISKLLFDVEAENLIRSAPPGTYRFIALNILKFKLINDNFGQEAGDRVLQYVYDTIAELLDDGELITRASADDFYILVKAKTKKEQEAAFRLYSERINSYNFNQGKKYFINLSFGIVLVDDLNLSLVQIRDRANIARKNAKRSYGELFSFVFYSDMERQQMIKEKDIENRMEDALREGEFTVFLQPKIEPEHNTVKGAEALVRWQTREGGFMMPGDFIPFFEKNGFIVKLDLYVFERTCALLRSWMDSGVEPIPISVNMSRAHLGDPDFLKQYKAIAQKYHVPGALLEIELTESMFFENVDALIEVISKIHEAGFLCAMDDFGSGYSSLSMLTDIHVDSLKLDKAFWKPGREGDRAHDVIAMAVELGRRLNMLTVSEGVETVSQLEFLRKIRCDLVQGYVFSKPVPAPEFEMLAFGRSLSGHVSFEEPSQI
ncbi:EAL domain-containing protein [Lactonifactor longoviformis]|uniref:bifunctional diguanylate cyclase/phosphodiesterase n=1 Tax=Lactonifactor longoviformis TaxID=341220 RepID=UPI0021092C27|nr:EAL domain-containing protein [Lactonifactor longoviformis]MCQ4670561.1 EAL domain-containing protein [Lactonifactor longoviformis]